MPGVVLYIPVLTPFSTSQIPCPGTSVDFIIQKTPENTRKISANRLVNFYESKYDGDMDKKEFGQLIAILRQELGWTQFQLAEYAEMDEGTLSNIERGVKRHIEPDILFRLANALQLTSLERREFFLAASGIEQEKIVRQPGFSTPTKVFNPEKLLDDLKKQMEQMYAPCHLGDAYGDVICVSQSLLEMLHIEPEVLQMVSQSSVGFNNLHFIYGTIQMQKAFGDTLSESALASLRAFREGSLRYRTKPRFQKLLKEFRDIKKYPLFERYWRKVMTMDHDKEAMLEPIVTQHPTYGALKFISTSAVILTPYGELFLSHYTPADRSTAQAFLSMMERVGTQIIDLTPWPQKDAAS